MAIAAAAVGSGITATAILASSGIEAWLAHSAQQNARRESRRVEALNIKFANEENKRNEFQFIRELGLRKEELVETKKNNRFNKIKTILDGLTNMHNQNLETFEKVKGTFGKRRDR